MHAITGLEQSLAQDRPRALIQMATGAGKTFIACTFSHRLIKHAGARCILFLVDRNNLREQALKEFRKFHPHGSAHRFTDTYIVQQLRCAAPARRRFCASRHDQKGIYGGDEPGAWVP